MTIKKNTQNVLAKNIFFEKKISTQGLISTNRVHFFLKNNTCTCSAIRDTRVHTYTYLVYNDKSTYTLRRLGKLCEHRQIYALIEMGGGVYCLPNCERLLNTKHKYLPMNLRCSV